MEMKILKKAGKQAEKTQDITREMRPRQIKQRVTL
jgi:hypothetical protein